MFVYAEHALEKHFACSASTNIQFSYPQNFLCLLSVHKKFPMHAECALKNVLSMLNICQKSFWRMLSMNLKAIIFHFFLNIQKTKIVEIVNNSFRDLQMGQKPIINNFEF
jgi:hypothetical protein